MNLKWMKDLKKDLKLQNCCREKKGKILDYVDIGNNLLSRIRIAQQKEK
jgi:hypothetical protein